MCIDKEHKQMHVLKERKEVILFDVFFLVSIYFCWTGTTWNNQEPAGKLYLQCKIIPDSKPPTLICWFEYFVDLAKTTLQPNRQNLYYLIGPQAVSNFMSKLINIKVSSTLISTNKQIIPNMHEKPGPHWNMMRGRQYQYCFGRVICFLAILHILKAF